MIYHDVSLGLPMAMYQNSGQFSLIFRHTHLDIDVLYPHLDGEVPNLWMADPPPHLSVKDVEISNGITGMDQEVLLIYPQRLNKMQLLGFSEENHRKIVGKPWENHRKMVV